MNIPEIIQTVDNWLWATPLIALIFFSALAYSVAMKFSMVSNWGLQWRLLKSGGGSVEGLSPIETFCSVAAYRVAVGNIGGVMVAIMYGGPGAVFWMPVTALVTSAIAYAENSLGQIYKVRQDGQYRGGPYNYIEMGLGWRPLAIAFALLALIGVPLAVTGPSANNIAMAFENSLGISPVISGTVVAFLLFLVIAGGVRRIAKFSTFIVPIMTVLYVGLTIAILAVNFSKIPGLISLIVTSAFSTHAIFGGLFGAAISYGIKRAVNSSGSGFGETPPSAAAAECPHPATQGIVNASSVYIDVVVCIASGVMALITDCFNVLNPDGSYMYIGKGSSVMAQQAATNTAGVVWVQEAANTVFPLAGGILVALSLVFFAFSTCVVYYYEGEAALAYLARKKSQEIRNKMIWVIRIIMPITFFLWANIMASTAWAISEVIFGLMAWVNGIVLIFLFPTVMKVYNDYMSQLKAGIEEPYFNPLKLGIKNADLWMDINKERMEP